MNIRAGQRTAAHPANLTNDEFLGPGTHRDRAGRSTVLLDLYLPDKEACADPF
jgi:hypothetical protein